ncbi:hypothetical protein OWV82_011275 [Melia azedarach]|uniref:Uncharacterized protein n=1 Tax=Melia azedarach TaxID=155640 RepID=A0ACC1XYA2_MELAZ|nr:hypothetical protein OWV82_011275 [Melia azedarach]
MQRQTLALHPRSSRLLSILGLVISPQLINILPQQLDEEVSTVPTSHLLVKLCDDTVFQTVEIIQKPGCNIITLIPSVTLTRLYPVARPQVSLQPHEIRNPFDQSAGSLSVSVPLPYMRHFVIKNSGDFPPHVAGIAPYVVGADMNFVVNGIRDAVHAVDKQADFLHIFPVSWVGLLEGPPYEVCGGC